MTAVPEPTLLPIQPELETCSPAARIRPGSFAGRLKTELVRSARAHSLLAILVLVYWATAFAVSHRVGLRQDSYLDMLTTGLQAMTVLYFGGLLIAYVVYVMVAVRPRRLVRHLWGNLASRVLTLRRLCIALPVALLLPMLLSSYSSLKGAIPLIHVYDWDPTLAHMGGLLHGGRQPWEWLQPVLGHPWVTLSVNVVYNSWYFIFYSIFIWQMTSTSRPRLRMQYLLACVLQWALLGNLVATLMPSVGPAFYSRLVGGPDPYAPLMAYLHSVDSLQPVWALQTQDLLWQCYANKDDLVGCGISAMPSMHVATAFSFALLGFATDRRLGAVLAVYCALILIGSVHLGWHYASDGYVAILGTWLIWLSVGWFLARPRVSRWLALEQA